MSKVSFETFASRDALDQRLAAETAGILERAIQQRGQAALVVSGGSTPLKFFELLSQQSLDWDKVNITLADERWVSPQHSDSNERLVRERLLVNNAATATFVPLKNVAETADEGESECERALAAMGRFDLLILGMGGDGHTASLFPGASNLARGLDLNSGRTCISMQPLTAPHQRMSLTLPCILEAEQIVIHITGEEKKSVIETALQLEDQTLLPISAVLQQQKTPVRIFWAE